MDIACVVGSTNRDKVTAVQMEMAGHFGTDIQAQGEKADPGITHWRSERAPGQPFGVEQTAYGAIHRMRECQPQTSLANRTFTVAFENGLAPSEEVGDSPGKWVDICYVALKEVGTHFGLIKRGPYMEAPFDCPTTQPGPQFDKAVQAYRDQIMPQILQGHDLYQLWSGGRASRQDYLRLCLKDALREHENVKQAERVLQTCVQKGMAASAGDRYAYMDWTRDRTYMTPAHLAMGNKEALLQAFRSTKETQCRQHQLVDDGYQMRDHFGKIPIVTIAKENRSDWLRLRVGAFLTELWYECKGYPLLHQKFPKLPQCEGDCADELAQYGRALKSFWERELKPLEIGRGPSFSLQAYLDGKLANLTPGTRDSEIQFLRGLFTLLESVPANEKGALLHEFAEVIGRALCYLFTQVIDPEDHLPLGADTRDNFSHILYDAKLLSNAVYWAGVLEKLADYGDELEKTSLRQTISQEIASYQGEGARWLQRFLDPQQRLSTLFAEEMETVKASIHHQLLFQEGRFKPRDFIPGTHAKIDPQDLSKAVNSIPHADLVSRGFLSGEEIDPQSLAQAILAGLIPPEHYDDVIALFKKVDSSIGITVFVPISAKAPGESEVLRRVKGRVVWPHISWVVVQALLFMKERGSSFITDPLDFAERQREKLMSLPQSGCGEWYAFDPQGDPAIVQGGDTRQGWSAAQMLMGMKALYRHYEAKAAI